MIFFHLQYPPDRSQFNPFIKINGIFLSVMLFLHVYWFSMFVRMLKKFARGEKIEDEQHKVQKA